eukprot:979132-Pelagomonas_calceolata.AAC.6
MMPAHAAVAPFKENHREQRSLPGAQPTEFRCSGSHLLITCVRVESMTCVFRAVVNLRADEGHSSECIQSSWHYSKADVEKGDGLSIPAAPLVGPCNLTAAGFVTGAQTNTPNSGERVRLIPLTKGIHVLMPLRAQSAKHILYQTSIQAALRHVPRPHLPETIPLPAQQAIVSGCQCYASCGIF